MTSDSFLLSKTLQTLTMQDSMQFQSGGFSPSKRLQSTENKFLFSSPTRNQKVYSLSPVSQSIIKDVFTKTGSYSNRSNESLRNASSSPTKETDNYDHNIATRDGLYRCLRTLENERNPALKNKAIEQLYHKLEIWYPLLDLELVRQAIETIAKNLQFYKSLDEQFILFGVYIIKHLLRIEMVMMLMDGPNNTEIFSVDLVLSVFNLLLYDTKLHKSIHLAIARTLISAPMGESGIDVIVNYTSSVGYCELVQDILTLLSNDAHVQRTAIAPMLVQEMSHTDVNRKLSALRALSKLYTRAEESLPALLDELTTGYLQRHLISKTIRSCGKRGERVLAHLLKYHQNFRIRVCAAQGLGSPPVPDPVKYLQVIVNEGIDTTFHAPGPRRYVLLKSVKSLEEHQEQHSEPILEDDPYALKTYLQDGLPSDYEDILLVDYRQFLSFVCKGLEQGKFAWNDPNRIHSRIVWSELKGHPYEEHEEDHQYFKSTEESTQSLCTALKDESPEVRKTAAEALGAIGAPLVFSAVQYLAKTLKDPIPEVRASAALSLSCIGTSVNPSQEVLKNLQEMLKDPIWKVRFAACKAIGSFGEKSKQYINDLMKVLVHGTVERTHVAMVLVNLGQGAEEALIDVLLQQVTKYGSQIRKAAAFGLSAVDILNIPSQRADLIIEKLFEASGDSRPIIRSAVLSSLGALARKANERIGYLKSASLLSFLYTFLKDKDNLVRETAAQLIARNKAGDAGELLLIQGALKETNAVIRTSSVHGLYWIGPKCLRTILLTMNDISASVRKESCRTVTAWSFQDLVKSFEKKSNSQKQAIVVAINEILSSIESASEDLGFPLGIEIFLKKLRKALDHVPGNIVHNHREYSPSKAASPVKAYLGSSLYNTVDEIHL